MSVVDKARLLFSVVAGVALATLLRPGPVAAAPDGEEPSKAPPAAVAQVAPAAPAAAAEGATATADGPTMDIVFCIDCSGSMSPSLERAKAGIRLILEDAAATYPGLPMRLGLLRYGDGDRQYAFFNLPSDFITALNRTRIEVAAGAEYFGAAVAKATKEMAWSTDSNSVRRLYLVGNETAHQGPLSYRASIPEAVKRGIAVSSFYCPGPGFRPGAINGSGLVRAEPSERQQLDDAARRLNAEITAKISWVEAAGLGGGQFLQLNYDADRPLVAVWTPEQFLKELEWINSGDAARQRGVYQAIEEAERLELQERLRRTNGLRPANGLVQPRR